MLGLYASAAKAVEPVESDLLAEEVVAVDEEAEEDALSGVALRKYVKLRLPGGLAAQWLTATGRRKDTPHPRRRAPGGLLAMI